MKKNRPPSRKLAARQRGTQVTYIMPWARHEAIQSQHSITESWSG